MEVWWWGCGKDGGGLFVGEGAYEAEAVGVGGELDVNCGGCVCGQDSAGEEEDDDVREVWGEGNCEGEFGRLAVGLGVDWDDVCEAGSTRNYDGEHRGGERRE